MRGPRCPRSAWAAGSSAGPTGATSPTSGARHPCRGRRSRRQLLRHRRRLRPGPQRDADRPVPQDDQPATRIYVATKLGRFPEPGLAGELHARRVPPAHRGVAQAARRRGAGPDAAPLHPDRAAARRGESFDWLRTLQKEGKIRHFGASVESMDEALICLEQEGLTSLQIIFNIFRQKPITALFDKARHKGVALIVRLPLASGLLSGKMTQGDARSPPTTTATTTATARRSTSARRSPACRSRRAWNWRTTIKPLVPAGHDDGADGPAVDPGPRGRQHGHPRRQQPGAGPGQRRRQRPAAAAATNCTSGCGRSTSTAWRRTSGGRTEGEGVEDGGRRVEECECFVSVSLTPPHSSSLHRDSTARHPTSPTAHCRDLTRLPAELRGRRRVGDADALGPRLEVAFAHAFLPLGVSQRPSADALLRGRTFPKRPSLTQTRRSRVSKWPRADEDPLATACGRGPVVPAAHLARLVHVRHPDLLAHRLVDRLDPPAVAHGPVDRRDPNPDPRS